MGQQCLCYSNMESTPLLHLASSEICAWNPPNSLASRREGGRPKKKDRQTERGTKDRGKSCQLVANETSSWGFPSPQRVNVYLACLSVAPLRKHTKRMYFLWLLTYGCRAFRSREVNRKERLTYGQCKTGKPTCGDRFFLFFYLSPALPPFHLTFSKVPSMEWGKGKHSRTAYALNFLRVVSRENI